MSSFIYYGLTLGVGCLHGNPGINMILMGIGDSMQSVIVWSLSKWLVNLYIFKSYLSRAPYFSINKFRENKRDKL